MGLTIEPCGTPDMIVLKSLVTLLMHMHCFLLERYEWILTGWYTNYTDWL